MIQFVVLAASLALPPPAVDWKVQRKAGHITVRTVNETLNRKYVAQVKRIYSQAYELFNKYEKIGLNNCSLGPLTVNIISSDEMNDRIKFRDNTSSSEVFGRYFWKHNYLYITPETFKRNEFLVHELVHYFYDECGIFRGIEREERDAYTVQELYLRYFE